MLNNVEWLPDRILERPMCAWFEGALWVAYLDLNGYVVISKLGVNSSPVAVSPIGLGVAAAFAPAIAVFRNKLIVAIGSPGSSIQLFKSDGTSVDPPIDLGFESIIPPALAVAQDLWLGWMNEDADLHLARSSNGVNFDDELTSVRHRTFVAMAGLPASAGGPAIAVAWRDHPKSQAVLTVFDEEALDVAFPQTVTLPEEGINNISLVFAAGQPAGETRVIVCTEVQEASTRAWRMIAHQVTWPPPFSGANPITFTGAEQTPHFGFGPGLTRGAGRNWAAWRDMGDQADHLVIGPYDIAFDLPPELSELLRKECDPLQCPPDLRLVCSATEDFNWKWEPGWIRNARKGDLVITPASGAGVIGGFLKKLRYEQLYDHMGIMIDDGWTVRHATMAHDRIKEFNTGSVFGEPAPTDGIRPDVLKYGWPGTITQSVQNGFFDWEGFNDGANPEWNHPTPPEPPPADNAPAEEKQAWEKDKWHRRHFRDPETQKLYKFANLTWLPQYRPDGTVVNPVVVKPPPKFASDPDVRATLHRVAEAAKLIRGHYRFYAYSDGTISENPLKNAPPKGDPYWNGLSPGADWAAGSCAVVCSTFIWAAVRRASRTAYPQLWLEGQSETTPEESYRKQNVFVHDGLYRYHQDERITAAEALHEYTAAKVRSEVWAKMMKLKGDVGWIATVVRLGLTTVLALLTMPLAALASLLGIRFEQAQELVLALNDMPDDVATQMCNTFASDKPEETDDDLWKLTGDGLTVAPHNIIHQWDPPTQMGPRLHLGLWGYSERLILPEPRYEYRRKHVYRRSEGLAEVSGVISYRGEPVEGALVKIGCRSTYSGEHGEYRIEVGSSPQEIIAGAYWPQSQWWLEGRRMSRIRPGANPNIDLELEDPPEWRRVLQIRVKLDLVHQVVFGNDDWHHSTNLLERRFVNIPTDWGAPPGAPGLLWDDSWDENPVISDYAGDERARLRIQAALNVGDLSISVIFRAELIEDEAQNVEVSAPDHHVNVPMDESRTVNFSLKSAEVPPDRAWYSIEIHNLRELA